ncbi:phenylacetate--CoA ligase family protein [Chromatocurvus halotolerans]|uniref:Phenylacetate-CoA ligase n=1 Tax=Chromatocurvus halotolerans TaxID=1132028 RepID=A0A4R2KLM6_9GAMM|nr:AMP-binding protein [Chromatocurvus halotolerans]TCO74314.1 phenylacetate-CoA ligase [Chromatocurvus halotolerans]
MRLAQQFVANVLFPLQERFKGHTTQAAFRAMERNQWLSPEEMQALQLRELRDFLVRIGRTVPYYRALFAERGFDPADVTSVADLALLPRLDKPTIRANMESLKAEGSEARLKRFNTGGSSGEPLIFYLSNERVSHDVAAKRRATRWWGVDIGDREMVVWGSPIELGAQDRLRLLRDRLMRTELLSAFEMSEENLHRFVACIREARPAMLFGYPSSLAKIAEFAEGQGVALDSLGISVAFVTSERLYDHQQQAISRVFGCPVANGYGGRDAGFIAHACPAGSLHITAEDIVVEILNADGEAVPAGEAGEIVVTHLRTGDFPFVRYRTGDVGVLGEGACACGRGLPVMASVEGRSTDFVVAADGTVLHGLALIYVLRDIPEVANFRIVQESLAKTRVQVVPRSALQPSVVAAIRQGLRARLGESVSIEIEAVAELLPEASGKFRYVSSKVSAA